MAVGRPSVYSEEVANKICVRLADGESLRSICRDESMPAISSVLLWIVDGKHDEFSEQYAKAREAQAHNHVDQMLDMRDGLLDGTIDPAAARVVADIIKWSSERMSRKSFSAKPSAEDHDETPPTPVNITVTVQDASKQNDGD